MRFGMARLGTVRFGVVRCVPVSLGHADMTGASGVVVHGERFLVVVV
jgi:hypothetical protein